MWSVVYDRFVWLMAEYEVVAIAVIAEIVDDTERRLYELTVTNDKTQNARK